MHQEGKREEGRGGIASLFFNFFSWQGTYATGRRAGQAYVPGETPFFRGYTACAAICDRAGRRRGVGLLEALWDGQSCPTYSTSS